MPVIEQVGEWDGVDEEADRQEGGEDEDRDAGDRQQPADVGEATRRPHPGQRPVQPVVGSEVAHVAGDGEDGEGLEERACSLRVEESPDREREGEGQEGVRRLADEPERTASGQKA